MDHMTMNNCMTMNDHTMTEDIIEDHTKTMYRMTMYNHTTTKEDFMTVSDHTTTMTC